MIFVTVGTHEQPFNRLIKKVDELVRDGQIQDEVFMQIGFSTYEPKYCKWAKVIGYDEMTEFLEKADVVITHGGPSTYMQVLQMGKTPIVVPRQAKFQEHVNDHQMDFTEKVINQGYQIKEVLDMGELLGAINQIKDKKGEMDYQSHHQTFISQFEKEVNQLMKGKA